MNPGGVPLWMVAIVTGLKPIMMINILIFDVSILISFQKAGKDHHVSSMRLVLKNFYFSD